MSDDSMGRKGRATRSLTSLGKHIFLIFGILLVLLPLYFTVITSFKSKQNYSADKFGFPSPFYTGNIETALRGGRYFVLV